MNKKINVLSLFDGYSSGQIALKRANVDVNKYYSSEIDKYAIRVTQNNWPDTIQLGSVEGWMDWDVDWSSIDLLIGGSPCQGFSFAGKGLNFDDPRSKLFFVYVDILNHIKTKNKTVSFLLENVKMKQSSMDVISDYLGVNPIEINSNLVSAQNRKRLYWANFHIAEPQDRKIFWGDVREKGVSEMGFYYTEKAMQWLARHSRRKNKLLKVHQDKEKMQMLEASHFKKYSSQRFFGIVDVPEGEEAVAAMRGRYILDDGKKKTKQFIEFRQDKKTNSVTTVGKDNVVVPFTLPYKVPADMFFFRYITPTECERLQTVPDGYTSSVSNTQRYKMLGNGWTIDIVSHIFKNLKKERGW